MRVSGGENIGRGNCSVSENKPLLPMQTLKSFKWVILLILYINVLLKFCDHAKVPSNILTKIHFYAKNSKYLKYDHLL